MWYRLLGLVGRSGPWLVGVTSHAAVSAIPLVYPRSLVVTPPKATHIGRPAYPFGELSCCGVGVYDLKLSTTHLVGI